MFCFHIFHLYFENKNRLIVIATNNYTLLNLYIL